MEGSYVGTTLEDIQREQKNIDKFIEKLLESDPATLLCEPHRETTTPQLGNSPLVAKRGRGRPPKTAKPPSSRSSLSPVRAPAQRPVTGKPSLDDIFECILKLNAQNRNLMQYVQTLSNSVDEKKCNCEQTIERDSSPRSETPDDVKLQISDRLERIEQSINSNILVCSGPGVPDLIKEVRTDSSVNFDRLKGNLCTAICGEEVTEIDIKNLRVFLFGRERKSLKIECANSSSKLHIIKQARRKRPKGIYISEFLSKPKLQTLNNLKNLKKLHPNKVKSVFTKEGNIFYTLQGIDKPVLVRSNQDLENIVRNLPTTDSSALTHPGISVPTTTHTQSSTAGETLPAPLEASATAEVNAPTAASHIA